MCTSIPNNYTLQIYLEQIPMMLVVLVNVFGEIRDVDSSITFTGEIELVFSHDREFGKELVQGVEIVFGC